MISSQRINHPRAEKRGTDEPITQTDAAPREKEQVSGRRLLHQALHEYLRQGWTISKTDKNGAWLVLPSTWNKLLILMGVLLLPLAGFGLLLWLLALLNTISGAKQQLFISMERLNNGLKPLRGRLDSTQRIGLAVFGVFFAAWLLVALPYLAPQNYHAVVELPREITFWVKPVIGAQFSAVMPFAGFSPGNGNIQQGIPAQEDVMTETPPAADVTLTITPTPTLTPLMPLSPTATPTATATATATEEPGLDPADWMHWDVLPRFSWNWVDIYQRGISQGNNPQAFSVVGDCQSVPYLFMGMYDGTWYSTDNLSSSLQETVSFFAGSFSHYGMTIIDGATAASVLSRGWANRNYCNVDESPLTCELRIHRPSFVIINIGTHWTNRNGEYLHTIVETIIDAGALPIMTTKADNLEGDYSINYQIAQIASDYDIPLWNLWRAVQELPGHGLDPYRQGGYMYLTPSGLEARRVTALSVLDLVRQAVD